MWGVYANSHWMDLYGVVEVVTARSTVMSLPTATAVKACGLEIVISSGATTWFAETRTAEPKRLRPTTTANARPRVATIPRFM
jgi:hypothetical protein